jgi:hypothetical protein
MKEMPAITTTQTSVMLFISQILLNLAYNPQRLSRALNLKLQNSHIY